MAAKQITTAELTTQIALQQRTDTANALGEAVPVWATTASGVWASRQPLRGREFFAAGQMQTPADVRFRIRWRPGITAAMRVLHQGLFFDIVGEPIDVDGRGITLELMCTSGVRDGR